MDPVTVDEVIAATEMPELKAAAAPKQSRLVAIANALFLRITGQTWESVPTAEEPLVKQAVQGLTEMSLQQEDPERLETMADFDLIQSFSAGPYSETRRSADEAMKAKLIVAWPWLSQLLWMLLTPDQYDYWISFFNNVNAPAWDVQEVDWSAGQDLLGGSYQGDGVYPYYFGA